MLEVIIMSYGCIYLVKNIQTHKVYIGKTKSKHFNNYINDHFSNALRYSNGKNRHFYRSIRKYGKQNFKWMILGYCNSLEELNEAEKECIYFFRSYSSTGETCDGIYGYNLTKGGDGFTGNHTEETKRKIGKSSKGRTNKSRLGQPHTEETKKKLKEANKGHKPTEYNRLRSKEVNTGNKYRLGTTQTEETKRKCSEANKGSNHPQYGKHHSENRKKKFVETRRKNNSYNHTDETKKIISKQSKNRIWINKEGKQITIKKEFLNFYLYYDWEIGRTTSSMKGKKHSEETKQKMRHPHKRKPSLIS